VADFERLREWLPEPGAFVAAVSALAGVRKLT
jgi:hypothetical protein